MAVQLPIELIYDILLRLNVGELCKFRCVSKSWKILISDPSFVHSHMQQSMKKIHVWLIERGRKLNPTGPLDVDSFMRYDDPFCGIKPENQIYLCRLMSIRPFNQNKFSAKGCRGYRLRQDPDLESGGLDIISCCGGLVLLSRCFLQTTKLCVMNLVSGRINELPILLKPMHGYRSSCYGLAYSNSRMEFKVVLFFCANDGYGCDILVLNDSPKWTRLHEDNLPTIRSNGTTAGGSLFFETSVGLILEFDVESNKISIVNNPPGWGYSRRDFVEINGELGMNNWNNTIEREVTEIWVLKNKENSLWVMAYSIKIRVHTRKYFIRPIYFVDEDTWFIYNGDSIFMCDKTGGNLLKIAPHNYKKQVLFLLGELVTSLTC